MLRAAVTALLLVALPVHGDSTLAATGRPVVEVIAALEARGLTVIYSTELLSSSMTVREEPAATEPVELLREILRPHGLGLAAGPRGAWLVVREAQSAPASMPLSTLGEAMSLEPKAGAPPIETIVVTASYYELPRDTVASGAYLSRAQLENLPTLGEDALRTTQRLPGMASTGVSARTNVRGGELDESLLRLDGMRLYNPYHFRDFESLFSGIDPAIIDGIEIRTGGYPAAYGDRMSGVVEMRSLTPRESRGYEVSASLVNTALFGSGRFGEGRGDWIASLRRSNLDLLVDAVDPDIGEPQYLDLFASLDYAIGDHWKVAGNVLVLDDQITLQDEDVAGASADYNDAYYWVRFEHTSAGGFGGRYLVSQTRLREAHAGFLADESSAFGELSEARSATIQGLAADWRYRFSDRQLLQWGGEMRDGRADYAHDAHAVFPNPILFEGTARTSLDDTFDIHVDGFQHALYASHRSRWAGGVTTELGLRWDRQTYTDESQLSPRGNVLVELGERTWLRAAAGVFHQAQGLEELQISDGVSRFFPAQRAEHYVLSVEHRLANALNLQVEAYTKHFDHLRPRFENLYTRLDLLPELQPDRIRIDPQQGESTGLEVALSQQLERWDWWANVAWSSVKDRRDGRSVLRSWDQPWSAGLGGVWSGPRWTFALAAAYHDGWPTTTLELVGDQLVAGEHNTERVGDFLSIDLRASRRFVLPRSEIIVFGELINALNRKNPCCLAYDLETEDEAGAPELELGFDTYLPLLPSIGVAWRF